MHTSGNFASLGQSICFGKFFCAFPGYFSIHENFSRRNFPPTNIAGSLFFPEFIIQINYRLSNALMNITIDKTRLIMRIRLKPQETLFKLNYLAFCQVGSAMNVLVFSDRKESEFQLRNSDFLTDV
uniref:Uncharacterized protein n=1 Tax=Syphacia muris TaxID=451379 RepID=A0A0N5B0Q7_9BILA